MDLNIRTAVKKNFQALSIDQMRKSVEDGISSADEVVLPGLGVLFEIVYQSSDETMKHNLLKNIKDNIK